MSPTGGGESPKPKRKRTDILFGNYAVPTHNKFSLLAEKMDICSNIAPVPIPTPSTSSVPKMPVTKNTRVPPITVSGKTRKEITDWCTSHDIKQYRLKMTSIGINLFCDNVEDFKKIKGQMKETKFTYFTHALTEERELRVILKGLFVMNEEELKNELKLASINPTSIRQLNPKKAKYTDQAHYILSFPMGSIKMSTLKQCRYLCHLVVEWDFYQPRKYGPTRCHNCNLFGHGKRQCSMQTKCPVCAENHTLDECPLVDDEGNLKEGRSFKCPNCNGAHPATHEKCPKLIEYLQIQERLAMKNSSKNRSRQFVLNPQDFQELPKPRQNAFVNAKVPPQQPWVTRGNTEDTSGLMSVDELIQLSQELVVALRHCRSREDQFNTIVKLAAKFVGNYGSP